jgi:ABC-type antimicrobial peptide transport system permease subunit
VPAVRIWLGLDLRRRWRSLVALALLVALSSGVIMMSLAGARRASTSVERLTERTKPLTVLVLPNAPGFDWEPVRALPQVEALSTFAVDYAIFAEGLPAEVLGFPPADDEVMRTLETPVMFSGRMYDPSRPDEVVVTPRFVAEQHRDVGDTIVLHLPAPEELSSSDPGPTGAGYHGPVVRAKIVGVGFSTWTFDLPGDKGAVALSPGLVATYPQNTIGDQSPGSQNFNPVNAMVRVKGGEAGLPAFQASFENLTKRSDIEFMNVASQIRDYQRHVLFEVQSLLAFAIAAFLAALFLVGQAVVRFVAGGTAELTTMRALGMTPRQSVLAAAAGPSVFSVAGAALGAVIAFAASPLFPIGSAGYLEPDPGLSFDPLVLPLAAVVVVLLTAAGAALSARTALDVARRDTGSRQSVIAGAVRRAGFGIPVLIGTRFALESGRGRTAVPVRPALLGSVVGVLGVVAAFTFSHGVSDASANPERFGQTFQYGVYMGFNGQTFGPAPEITEVVAAQPEVTGVDDSRTAVATGPDTSLSVSLWEYQTGPKPVSAVITEGRMARTADEVVLAPKTLTALDKRVGDKVELTGSTKKPVTFTVTGQALVPLGPHNGYADGGWIGTAGFNSLFGDGFKYRVILVSVPRDLATPATGEKLAAAVVAKFPDTRGIQFSVSDPPPELAQLRQVRRLPIALGLFLALLAVGAVGHALASAVRRRQHDIAVLRATGMTRWQSRWVVVVQASVLAAFGLVFGVPLGFALGRTLWRVVADYTPVEYVPPLAFWVLLLIVPGSLLVANLLAAWPGQRAARLRVAHVLRAE